MRTLTQYIAYQVFVRRVLFPTSIFVACFHKVCFFRHKLSLWLRPDRLRGVLFYRVYRAMFEMFCVILGEVMIIGLALWWWWWL